MGLLDDEYRGTWERQPANDPVHPWVGLLGRRSAQPPALPEGAPYPDAFAYPQPIPPGSPDDRAYNPTLQWQDSIPGIREARDAEKAQLDAWARRNADARFTRPKTAAEVGIPDQEPDFQQKLDGMSMSEKLKMLLDYLMGNR